MLTALPGLSTKHLFQGRRQCAGCPHPHSSHSRTRHKWEKEIGQETLVDEGMKKDWKAAKAEKDSAEELISTKVKHLDGLNRIIDNDMDELARLADGYTSLFSVHVEKAIRLYRDMEQPTGTLDLMKQKLELLKEAEEKEHSGRSGQWRSMTSHRPGGTTTDDSCI